MCQWVPGKTLGVVSNHISGVCSTAPSSHYGVGTDVISVEAVKLLCHLGNVLPKKKIQNSSAILNWGCAKCQILNICGCGCLTSTFADSVIRPISIPNCISNLSNFSGADIFRGEAAEVAVLAREGLIGVVLIGRLDDPLRLEGSLVEVANLEGV